MFDKLTTTHYAAIGAGAAVLVGLALWLAPESTSDSPPPEVVASTPATSPMAATPVRSPASGISGGIDPMSTKFDPARLFEIGYAGGLRIDGETQNKLDQILGEMGEQPTDADMAKLELALREGLPREDAEKAIKLVKGYKNYVGATRDDLTTHGIPTGREAVDAMFQRMQSNQARNFDPATTEALFGEEMRVGRLVMEAALVDQDPNLSFDQKKQRLDELRAQLPEDKRNSIVEPTKPEGAASAPAQ